MSESAKPLASRDETRTRLLSIRVRLLIVTSSVILLFVTILITLDYRREIRHHMQEKHADLMDEARTVLPGVLHLQNHGMAAVQKYIDSICDRMDDKHSPEHHIAVKFGTDRLLQTTSSHPISNARLSSIMAAPAGEQSRDLLEDDDLLIAVYAEGGTRVIVSENVSLLRSAVLGDEVFRLIGIALLGIIADGVVNLLLVRLIGQPLESLAAQVRAVGQGDFGVQSRAFNTRELNFLSSEIDSMSRSLAASERDRKLRLRKARDIQQNLLPHDVQIPDVNIAITYNPAEEVGGDYLDILPRGNRRWLVCVADATGHGVPAAMSAAMLKTLLLQASQRFHSPAEILREMNRIFMQVQIFGDFASLILIEIDFEGQSLTYANAGHDPAWLIAPSAEVSELTATGTLLGIDEDATWEEKAFELTANCRLAIATDGITETFGVDDNMFSKERLLETLLSCRKNSLAETNEYARQVVDSHRGRGEQTDDVTLLLMEFQLQGLRNVSKSARLHDVV
jgi:sigma-B regulation protein RsbU (phosphoserine phosphatase)